MYVQRIEALRKKNQLEGISAFLVSNFHNILYLTGFETLTKDEREGFVFITGKNAYVFTDARYTYEGDAAILKFLEPDRGLIVQLKEICTSENIKSIGFEAEDITYQEYNLLSSLLSDTKFVPTKETVVRLREIKEKEEINNIRIACELTDEVMREIIPFVVAGTTERELAIKLDSLIKVKRKEPSFDPIVAIDVQSAVPHYNSKNGHNKITNASVILLDFGIAHNGYASDITRMVFQKKAPTEAVSAYKKLLEVQTKTIERVEHISELNLVDVFCREEIKTRELPDFSHSTGHGVGLEVHEYPKISFNSQDKKTEGQVFTIEPGIYLEGKWGMRIEDTILIENGQAKALTSFPKELLVL